MNKFLLLLILFTVAGVYIYFRANPNQSTKNNVESQIGEIVEFSGVLNNFDDRCSVDYTCIAYVDDKEIITNPGDTINNLKYGKSEVWNDDVGSKVMVRAIKIGPQKYTLVGDDSLFVKIFNN